MPKPADKPKSFEAALTELEAIVTAMESPALPLDQALARYERGIRLMRFCEETLNDAEDKVRVLEGGELKPLADEPTGSAE